MVLNLDPTFNPLLNQKEVFFEQFIFSGGEPHIKIKSDLSAEKEITITHRIKSFNDLGMVLVATNALQQLNIQKINLFIPYFPAARQDRLMVPGEALTVKVYANIINQQNYHTVSIFDPHSEVAPALINNCKVINNFEFIEMVTAELPKNVLLISPDGGALKKIYKVAAHLQKYEVVECSKSRNVKTGQLTGFKVYHEDLKQQDCLIVDDICDGGGTFLGLAKELKKKNAGKLYLAVSHGIFSKGLDQLTTHFDGIFTTDSFKDFETSNHLKQIKLQTLKNQLL